MSILQDEISYEDQFTSSYRFFKFLMPLGAIDGYKKLNAIAFLSELGGDFGSKESYKGSWYWECLGPQSNLLREDVQRFGSMNWVVAVPQVKRGEPVHYRYLLSPAGLLELTRREVHDIIIERIGKGDRFSDYLLDIEALNTAPVSWSLALSSLHKPPSNGTQYGFELDRRDEFNHVDEQLLEQLTEFYSRMFGRENARRKGRTIAVLIKDPAYAASRYDYVKQDLWEYSPTADDIQLHIATVPVGFRKEADLDEYKVHTRVLEKRRILDQNRGTINTQVDSVLRDAEEFYADISRLGGQIRLQFLDGGVRLDLSKDILKGPIERRGTALIWNLLQPLEIGRLIRYRGLNRLVNELLGT